MGNSVAKSVTSTSSKIYLLNKTILRRYRWKSSIYWRKEKHEISVHFAKLERDRGRQTNRQKQIENYRILKCVGGGGRGRNPLTCLNDGDEAALTTGHDRRTSGLRTQQRLAKLRARHR